MIAGKDIIVVGIQPWDVEIGSNCKNIAYEFSKSNRVLYVNAPLDQHSFIKYKNEPFVQRRLEIMKNKNNLLQVADNIWNLYPEHIITSINWLPGNFLYNKFNKLNNKKFAADIMKGIERLSFKDFILFNDSDMLRSYYLDELLEPSLSIYYSRDNLMAVEYWRKHGRVLEPKLMKKSSLVCSNSPYLAEIARQYNANSFYVGQGCDFSMFDPAKVSDAPADISTIKRPVIGYIGAVISSRLDLDLLSALCERKSEWSFVFVGEADQDFKNSKLNQFENVHFLGKKDQTVLASYLNQFDVAINPQVVNAMTVGNYPRKIDEYLSFGKPVVATDTVTMSGIFKEFVYLAKSVDDYIILIDKALKENNPSLKEQRIQFAKSHTWENSVQAIYDAVSQVKPNL